MRAAIRLFLVITVIVVAVIEGAAFLQRHRQDLPWAGLDLAARPGRFTTAKLIAVSDDPERCQGLLSSASIDFVPAPPVRPREPVCGYRDGVVLGGTPSFVPSRLVTSCPVAAALHLWRRNTLEPLSREVFGSPLARIEHYGSYQCRRMGRDRSGGWSEHATADAVDIAAFVLADGRRITVRQHWQGSDQERRFLRDARDGACAVFATTLSPDYNADHADHFHLDQASRGRTGWNYCR